MASSSQPPNAPPMKSLAHLGFNNGHLKGQKLMLQISYAMLANYIFLRGAWADVSFFFLSFYHLHPSTAYCPSPQLLWVTENLPLPPLLSPPDSSALEADELSFPPIMCIEISGEHLLQLNTWQGLWPFAFLQVSMMSESIAEYTEWKYQQQRWNIHWVGRCLTSSTVSNGILRLPFSSLKVDVGMAIWISPTCHSDLKVQ